MTKDIYDPIHPNAPLFSLDCEMCFTTAGKNELTKICIVDSDCNVVYQSLVQPPNQITNYLTMYSGITKEMLMDVTTTLEEVQEELRKILPADAILVGQGLGNDLHALKLMHPDIIGNENTLLVLLDVV